MSTVACTIALALLVILVVTAFCVARWTKRKASRKVKDSVVLLLGAAFAAGAFHCFPHSGGILLVTCVAVCVAADFFSRKGGNATK